MNLHLECRRSIVMFVAEGEYAGGPGRRGLTICPPPIAARA
jgi:hypothetical protein